MVIGRQLHRKPRDVISVAVRCPYGWPAVIETPPRLSDGEPNPTLLYLTCPTLVTAVSRAEAEGGVRALRAAASSKELLKRRLESLTESYRQRRSACGPDLRPGAGIGGPSRPEVASCLHAYAAALLAAQAGWLPGPQHSGAERADAQPAGGIQAGSKPVEARLVERAPSGLTPEEAVLVWNELFRSIGQAWCGDDRCGKASSKARSDPPVRRAVIDVGTISVRLLVADVDDGKLRTVERRTEITRLGEGLRPGRLLEVTARERTAMMVLRMAEEAHRLGAEVIWLVGTSAARDAADGTAFISDLARETGAEARVLRGEEEAALAYAGASFDVPDSPVVLDVGGGSTELIRAGERSGLDLVSLDLGASRDTERWLRSDPPSSREVNALYQEAAAALAPLRPRFGSSWGPLVGVAGTVTSLACLALGLSAYRSDFIHLSRLELPAVREWVSRLGTLTIAEREALPCLQPGRAAVIVAGAVIVQAAMEVLGHRVLTVSERDLLDGVALRGLSSLSPT